MSNLGQFELAREHAILTTQASPTMVQAGAKRIQEERAIYEKEGWGEPTPELLAAAAYEAMVFAAIGRGLNAAGVNVEP